MQIAKFPYKVLITATLLLIVLLNGSTAVANSVTVTAEVTATYVGNYFHMTTYDLPLTIISENNPSGPFTASSWFPIATQPGSTFLGQLGIQFDIGGFLLPPIIAFYDTEPFISGNPCYIDPSTGNQVCATGGETFIIAFPQILNYGPRDSGQVLFGVIGIPAEGAPPVESRIASWTYS
jgi:hypothetical protein